MGGVITCPEKFAADAGLAMFKQGGNAMDAAIATAIAQCVTNPMLVGIGGGGTLNAFSATRGGRHECIYFGGVAGARAVPGCYEYIGQAGKVTGYKVKNDENEVGYKAAMTPGFFRGMYTGFLRHGSGRVAWRDLFQPAIRFARDGFTVDNYVHQFWKPGGVQGDADIDAKMHATPECARIYLKNGRVYQSGEVLVQPDMAQVIERVANEGPDVFYVGEIGQIMAADFAQHNGLLAAEDLGTYQALLIEPVRTTYRGYEITTDPPPACGVLVIEMLNVLELYDVKRLGWNTPEYLDILSRVMYLVFHDRARFMGDPRFVDVPVEMLVSKGYAAQLKAMIDRGADLRKDPYAPSPTEGTTHVSVMDDQGNTVGITHSLGSGCGAVTRGLGFMHNNHMSMFDPRPGYRNSLAPGKMPVTGGSPTIILKDGRPVIVVGSPAGARKATGIVQSIVNVIDFGMDAQTAVSVKRIHAEDVPGQVIVEPDFPTDTITGLERLGRTVVRSPYTARMALVYRDPKTGHIEGGSDPRAGGGKAVWLQASKEL
jgi:gamma-glutamyltranspeptidase/glutathione hydrolase